MAVAKPALNIQHLAKSFGDKVLYNDLSFGIAQGQHVGLIANNGMGKSTLISILCGKESADSGSIVFRNDLRIGYLEQSPQFLKGISVLEACFSLNNETTKLIKEYELCLNTPGNPHLTDLLERMEKEKAWNYEQKAKEILSKLEITDFEQPVEQLSGGQLKRVALANVLISEPDILMLDEPTNHLDLTMIEWLENFLKQGNQTLLMVTHDRYFLDRVCNAILEIDNQQIYTYKGNYAYFMEKHQERIDSTNAQIARANNLYHTELDWMRRMPCARGHKARYREEAFYELEKVAKQRIEERQIKLKINAGYIGNKIFEAAYINKSFGPDKVILKDFYYNFSRFEKMGIIGDNGTGKSTFIKLILGLEKSDSGHVAVGETVRFGYFSQDGMMFDEQMKVIDVIRNIAEYIDLGGGKQLTASQFLQHFLFSPEEQYNYVYKLSGGEKRRLYLCTVLMHNPNFLILDEPTNDLDIESLQILEEYLANFCGCVIIISHDRYFMDKVVDHLLVFKGNGIVEDFPGNYSQYREWNEMKEISQDDKEPDKKAKIQRVRLNDKQRMTYKEKKESEQLEKDIASLENEKKNIETALSTGELSVDEITKNSIRLAALNNELDEKSMRWLELSEIDA